MAPWYTVWVDKAGTWEIHATLLGWDGEPWDDRWRQLDPEHLGGVPVARLRYKGQPGWGSGEPSDRDPEPVIQVGKSPPALLGPSPAEGAQPVLQERARSAQLGLALALHALKQPDAAALARRAEERLGPWLATGEVDPAGNVQPVALVLDKLLAVHRWARARSAARATFLVPVACLPTTDAWETFCREVRRSGGKARVEGLHLRAHARLELEGRGCVVEIRGVRTVAEAARLVYGPARRRWPWVGLAATAALTLGAAAWAWHEPPTTQAPPGRDCKEELRAELEAAYRARAGATSAVTLFGEWRCLEDAGVAWVEGSADLGVSVNGVPCDEKRISGAQGVKRRADVARALLGAALTCGGTPP